MLLGEVILEQSGKKVFNAVEKLRQAAKKARQTQTAASINEIIKIVNRLDLDTKTKVLKAFTIYFHLVNEAEKVEIVRVNHERELKASLDKPRKESIASAIYFLKKAKLRKKDMQLILNKMGIQPVFTAHPTEAKRAAILRKLHEVSLLISQLQGLASLSERGRKNIELEIKNQISLLWNTKEVRNRKPTVSEEASNILFHLSETILPLVPKIYLDLQYALEKYYPKEKLTLPTFIKVGSWVGGDRDGNPYVTPEVTQEILEANSLKLLKKYQKSLVDLRHELTIGECSEELLDSIRKDKKLIGLKTQTKQISFQEPYVEKIFLMEKRLEENIKLLRKEKSKNYKIRYKSSAELMNDLVIISDSLKKSRLKNIASHSILSDLLTQLKTFGFRLVELDIRQHSAVQENAMGEILAKKNILKTKSAYKNLDESQKQLLLRDLILQDKNIIAKSVRYSTETKKTIDIFNVIAHAHKIIGKRAVRCYVISFTQSPSDVLEALLFAKAAGLVTIGKNSSVESKLDIVPLFETLDDLKNSSRTLEALFKNKVYRSHLKSRNFFQEIMLGFSDSGKDGGYLSANIEIYKAQKNMANTCRKHKISWRFFHGRGGSIGRGGAQAGKAIQAEPTGSVNGKIRFTEQGEVVAFRYSILPLAHRHFEAITHSVILASRAQRENKKYNKEIKLLEKLGEASRERYRNTVYGNKYFWDFFVECTPYKFISDLNIASRPTARSKKPKIEDLRAITWGFSLTQTRLMLNSWFGIGTALQEVSKAKGINVLRALYKSNSFFQVIINSSQQAIAKADLHTAGLYISLMRNQKIAKEIFSEIKTEYLLTRNMLLKVTNQKEILDNKPVIKKSIQLRNPYTDPLNCIQMSLMKELKEKKVNKTRKAEIISAILLSINGVAAAMQETG